MPNGNLRLLPHVKVSLRCLFKGSPIQSFGVVITFFTFSVLTFKAINFTRTYNLPISAN